MKKQIIALCATFAFATMTMLNTECKKEPAGNFVANDPAKAAARDYSNNDLVRLIKKNNPPLTDKELTAVLIAASPLDDHIIKEVLKRGQPPANAAISDETLQLILLRNLPLSDHIQKEAKKYRGGHIFDRNLIGNLQVADIPDMKLYDANFLIEAALNLKYGDAHAAFDSIEPVKHTFQVPGKLYSGQYFLMAHDFISAMDSMRLQCEQDEAGGCSCFSKKIRGIDLNVTTATEPATADKIFRIDLTVFLAVQMVDMEKILPADLCSKNEVWGFDSPYGCSTANCNPPFNSQQYNCAAHVFMDYSLNQPDLCQNYKIGCDFFTDFQPVIKFNDTGQNYSHFLHIQFQGWVDGPYCISSNTVNLYIGKAWTIINSSNYKPVGYFPAIIDMHAHPLNVIINGQVLYWCDVYYAKCGIITGS